MLKINCHVTPWPAHSGRSYVTINFGAKRPCLECLGVPFGCLWCPFGGFLAPQTVKVSLQLATLVNRVFEGIKLQVNLHRKMPPESPGGAKSACRVSNLAPKVPVWVLNSGSAPAKVPKEPELAPTYGHNAFKPCLKSRSDA